VAGGPARVALPGQLGPRRGVSASYRNPSSGDGDSRTLARKKTQRTNAQPLPARDEATECELCQREVDRYTVHHLVPRARGGRFGPKAKLCPTCHRQLHAMFTEATLAEELNSIALLRANPQVNSYLRWVRKQKSAGGFKVRRANDRR